MKLTVLVVSGLVVGVSSGALMYARSRCSWSSSPLMREMCLDGPDVSDCFVSRSLDWRFLRTEWRVRALRVSAYCCCSCWDRVPCLLVEFMTAASASPGCRSSRLLVLMDVGSCSVLP